jgi:hypothetical protein
MKFVTSLEDKRKEFAMKTQWHSQGIPIWGREEIMLKFYFKMIIRLVHKDLSK